MCGCVTFWFVGEKHVGIQKRQQRLNEIFVDFDDQRLVIGIFVHQMRTHTDQQVAQRAIRALAYLSIGMQHELLT